MIEIKNLCFTYSDCKKGVQSIDLTISDGECVVLTGPSGGGKTTLTRLINGLAPNLYPGSLAGSILIDGQPLWELPGWAIGRQIGSVFQDPKSQFFSSELRGEVAFACENYGLSKSEIRIRTDGAINAFSLNRLQDQSLDVLSSGEKQRVAIASVYALSPTIYVCDEPASNLDDEGAERLAAALRKLKADGCTLIIAEHRLSWLSGIADRFIYINHGSIQWEQTAAQMNRISSEQRRANGLRELIKAEINKLSAPGGNTAALCAKNLCCRRKRTEIFVDFNFSLYPGQITALTGHNGAGKTSLALTLAGLWRESGGIVEIDGARHSAKQRRRRIWYSSNDTGTQFFTNSVTEELLLNADRSPERIDRARKLLKQLGLYEYKDVHPASLSGGQKQRLSIACGVLSDRSILIFDEPTSGLDGGNMEIIADILRSEAKQKRTILIITHDMELMRRCCDCAINMDADRKYQRPV